ncbi:MAG: GumC domain-containing protein, partial [Planctomycetota bacterium]
MIEYDFGSEKEAGSVAQSPVAQEESRPDPAAQLAGIIYSLLRHRLLMVNCAIIGTVCGFVNGALQPNVYEASGKLLVRAGVREAQSAETGALGGVGGSMSSAEAMSNELHILRNPKLMRMVAENVGSKAVLKRRDPRQGDGENTPAPTKLLHQFQAWWFGIKESDEELEEVSADPEFMVMVAAGTITSKLSARASRGSNVIDIIYRGQTPEISRLVVDAFLEEATEHHRDVFTTDPQLAFLKTQAEEAKSESEKANAELATFKVETGIFDLQSMTNSLVSRIEGTKATIATERFEYQSLKTRLAYLDEQIEAEDPEKLDNLELAPNPEFNRLRAEISNLKMRLLELTRRQGEKAEDLANRRQAIQGMLDAAELEF